MAGAKKSLEKDWDRGRGQVLLKRKERKDTITYPKTANEGWGWGLGGGVLA